MRKLPLQQAIPVICATLRISPVQLSHQIGMSDVGVRNWMSGRSVKVRKLQTRYLLAKVAREAGIIIEELE